MNGKPQNIIGPQLRQLREKKRMTQEAFASKCRTSGLKLSRIGLAKIEAQIRCVADVELVLLAKILRVNVNRLLP